MCRQQGTLVPQWQRGFTRCLKCEWNRVSLDICQTPEKLLSSQHFLHQILSLWSWVFRNCYKNQWTSENQCGTRNLIYSKVREAGRAHGHTYSNVFTPQDNAPGDHVTMSTHVSITSDCLNAYNVMSTISQQKWENKSKMPIALWRHNASVNTVEYVVCGTGRYFFWPRDAMEILLSRRWHHRPR